MITLLDLPAFIHKRYSGSHVAFCYKSDNDKKKISIEDYIKKSEAFSAFLIAYGIKTKQRVLTVMVNSPDWMFIEMGIFFSGAIHVPLSPLTPDSTLENIIESIRPVLIVVNSSIKRKQIEKILRQKNLVTGIIDLKEKNVFQCTVPDTFHPAKVTESNVAVILYTSGSTQFPKGVMLTHKNIITAIEEFSALDIFDDCTEAITFLPFNLSAERKLNYSYLLRGISICFPSQIESMSKSLTFFKPQIMAVVPFLIKKLLSENPDPDGHNFKGLKLVCGGAPLSKHLIDRFTDEGGKIYEVYGLTETASLLSYNTMKSGKTGTVGQVAKSISLRIAENSEIWVKGENIMKGYWINEDKADVCRNGEAWFQTGDIGELDENGFLSITGRKNNSFKNSKGEFIYPEQIESYLTERLSLALCIVFENEAGSLSVIIQPESIIAQQTIEDVLINYNSHKDDSRKINHYLIINNSDNQIITNTLKPNRREILEKYKKQLFFTCFESWKLRILSKK